ncbi:hypothetical protein MesoLjLc_12830 [Mesorhizobium sp. L-8-10]|uniref:TRAP transporter large permease n=1 Tax=Mesorhizobium sp. L-8-10 TaxID=2744523 RepID=UPI001926F5C7|nr:TRAP transporter large permease subunit [Mesorhizobium sp. L-8-10]BCH29353.1 hypothetical protein MesoLjLc_12830 [Mesorhizobium sp. L-8-10]
MLEVIVGLAALFFLSLLRVPIAFAMALVGAAGMAYVNGLTGALANVGQTAYDAAINYELSVMPLFVLMGSFVTRSRLSNELYAASYAFLGHRKGGLAMATVVACGGFSAVCGSSLATAATMSKVAMPSMRHYRYDDGLAAGAIAAGGTLGILIPPSVLMVLYGVMTQTSIGKLFAAGVLPGLVGILFYVLAVAVATAIKPELGPRGPYAGWSKRFAALRSVWGVLLLFAIVMGGIYGGVFTPTEAAGIGAAGAFVFFLVRRETSARLARQVITTCAAGVVLLIALSLLQSAAGHVDRTFALHVAASAAVLLIIVSGQLVLGRGELLARNGWRDALQSVPRLAALLTALGLLVALAAGRPWSGGAEGVLLFLKERGVLLCAALTLFAFLAGLVRSTAAWGELYETLLESVVVIATLFMILIGALLFANFVNYTYFPDTLLQMAASFRDSPWLVLVAILLIYVVLGCFFESISMILLTVPIFFPLVQQLAPGFGLTPMEASVWFGILVVVITEISLITPPVGMNVFVLRGLLPDIATSRIFRGIAPFLMADIFRLFVIAAFPALSLWLTYYVK